MTAECLALREQVAIYEEQLANMEAQHKTVREKKREREDIRPQCDEAGAVYGLKMTLNVALRSNRGVGEMPRPGVTNTTVMTPVTLLKSCSPKQPCQQERMGRGLHHKTCNLVKPCNKSELRLFECFIFDLVQPFIYFLFLLTRLCTKYQAAAKSQL